METGAISHSQIDVAVSDADGSPLPGVTGSLSGGTHGVREEMSNVEGRMTFRDLPPGAYRMDLSLEGFETAHREVTIHEDSETHDLTVTLKLAGI